MRVAESDDYLVRAWRFLDRGDLVAARRVLEPAAISGRADAQLMVGYCHDVRGSRGRAEALRWYRKAVAGGEAAAASNIGVVYRDAGQTRLARRWFWRAFKMGLPEAMLELALLSKGKRRVELLRRMLRHKVLTPSVEEEGVELLAAALRPAGTRSA